MAAAEIYDYIASATANNDVTLSLDVRGDIVERGMMNFERHYFDDGTFETIILDNTKVAFVDFAMSNLSESDAGTLFDAYWNSGTGNMGAESFKWTSSDGHTYVVVFETDLSRSRKLGNLHGFEMVTLRILGKV